MREMLIAGMAAMALVCVVGTLIVWATYWAWPDDDQWHAA